MAFEAVISCPQCLRQYATNASFDGKPGQCASCKSLFVISAPTLASGGDEPVVFDSEITPGCSFIREACAEMANSARDLLKLAGEPFSVAGVVGIVRSIPRSYDVISDERRQAEPCIRLLKQAYLRVQSEDKVRYEELFEYFLRYIPNRSHYALDSLEGAFIGVLGSMIWPEEKGPAPEPPPVPEPKRGPLERWAARRGW